MAYAPAFCALLVTKQHHGTLKYIDGIILTGTVKIEVSYTNTSGSAQTLTAALRASSGETVYMDCVQVEMSPTASRYNLVQNGDFSFAGNPAAGWTAFDFGDSDTRTTLEESAAPQLDNNVFKMVGHTEKYKKLRQTINISGKAGDTYVVAGWGKGDSVPFDNLSDDRNRQFGIRVTFNNTDDTETKVVARFNPTAGSEANWQYTAAAAVAKKAYDSIYVDVMYFINANTAYFDGIQLYKEEFSNSYTYDDDGNIISVTDLQKQNTEYEYENNNLVKQTLPNGAEMKYTYDGYHNVKTATTDTGLKYTFTYDDYGNNTKVSITSNGTTITSTATYSDDFNRMVTATDATGKVTTYNYNADTNVLEWVKYPEDTDASRTNYTYDNMYRMATATMSVTNPLREDSPDLSAIYSYEDDLLTNIQTPSTTYTFNYGDFALRKNIKIGSRTLASYSYTDKDNYLSTLDYGNQDKVEYTYDNQGRVTKQTYEDGATVEYRYDNDGALATVTDSATGRTTTYYYDFIDRMMKYVETGNGYYHSVGYEYDKLNNMTKLAETINGTTYASAYVYDKDNRVVTVAGGLDTKTEDGKAAIGSAAIKDYTYDDFGRVSKQETSKYNTSYVAPESVDEDDIQDLNKTVLKTDEFTFSAPTTTTTSSQVAGHTITLPGKNTYRNLSYTYDDNGNITQIKDNDATIVSYVYDSANQLIRENNQAGGFTHTWTYDNAGNITKREVYDYTTGTLGEPTGTIAYKYDDDSWGDLLTEYKGQTVYSDAIGNPVNIGTWHFKWQHGRQLAHMEGKPAGNEPYVSIDYTYNADGIRTKKEVTTYTLQNVGNRSGVYLCSDGEVRYFTNGQLTSAGLVQDENGDYYYIRSSLVAVRGQDYWITNTNGLLEQASYTFGSDGRMIVDLGHGDNGELYSGMRTDADGETRYYVNGVPTYAGLVLLNGDYYYFNSHKVAVRNGTYSVTKTNDLLPAGSYTFDANCRIVNPTAPTAQTGGTPVMPMATNSGYQVWVPGDTVTYNYVYNGDKLSQMSVGTTSLTFTYDASGSPLSVIYDTDTTDSAAGSVYYYVTNIQGDVIAILDNSGTVVAEYAYDAWGNPIVGTETSAQAPHALATLNPLRYRGYVYDTENELYYLQSRYYNPERGRFLNADTFAATGQGLVGNNVFCYCNNNTIMLVDSLGKRPVAYNGGQKEADDTRVWSLSYMNNKKVDLTYKLTTFMEEKAKEMEQYYHTHSLLKSALYFKNNVTDGGIWDIKLQDDWTFERGTAYYFNGQQLRYDDAGNINFGYVGAVLFAEPILCAGAGANQIKKYGFQFGDLSTFYDDPRDNQMIKYGYQLYMGAH